MRCVTIFDTVAVCQIRPCFLVWNLWINQTVIAGSQVAVVMCKYYSTCSCSDSRYCYTSRVIIWSHLLLIFPSVTLTSYRAYPIRICNCLYTCTPSHAAMHMPPMPAIFFYLLLIKFCSMLAYLLRTLTNYYTLCMLSICCSFFFYSVCTIALVLSMVQLVLHVLWVCFLILNLFLVPLQFVPQVCLYSVSSRLFYW